MDGTAGLAGGQSSGLGVRGGFGRCIPPREEDTRGRGEGTGGEHDVQELGLPCVILQVPIERTERDEGKRDTENEQGVREME